MAVMTKEFWQDFKHHIKGLDGLSVRKATLILEAGQPVRMELEIFAEPIDGTTLTKIYLLQEEPQGEDVNITSLSDDTEKYAWRPKGGYS